MKSFSSLKVGGGRSSGGSDMFDDDNECFDFKLTRMQRLYGFAGCCVLGYTLSFLGTVSLFKGRDGVPTFAILYVLGSIIALCGTGFVAGPKNQCVKMWAPTRRIATAVYLTTLIAVIVVAAAVPDLVGLVILLLIIQACAAVWYVASYIPYGRKVIIGCFKKYCCCKEDV